MTFSHLVIQGNVSHLCQENRLSMLKIDSLCENKSLVGLNLIKLADITGQGYDISI